MAFIGSANRIINRYNEKLYTFFLKWLNNTMKSRKLAILKSRKIIFFGNLSFQIKDYVIYEEKWISLIKKEPDIVGFFFNLSGISVLILDDLTVNY